MEFMKAGECLSCGLGHELMKKDPTKQENLKAFVTFFALKGYLSARTVEVVQEVVGRDSNGGADLRARFIRLAKLFVEDFKKSFEFSDYEQLTNELNKINIPSWVFATKGRLLDMFPNAYLVNELIYYIVNDEGKRYFRCIHVANIKDMLKYRKDYYENFIVDMFSDDEINYTISTKYSEILGFNKETKTFYLKYRHTQAMYAEYHVDTKQEKICRYHCLGVVDNKFPIIEKDNCLAAVVGETVKKIKHKDVREKYEFTEGGILVLPAENYPIMFKPYILQIDGQRREISQNQVICFIWKQIQNDMHDFRVLVLNREIERIEQHETPKDMVFSLEYLDDLLVGRLDLESNKAARTYQSIVALLKKYLPSEEDVMDYLFLLAEVSKRLSEDVDERFIGEKTYWLLNELHSAGKLSKIITNKNKLKNKLLEGAYWTDERLKAEKSDEALGMKCFDYVGYFAFSKGKFDAHTVKISEALHIGDMMFVNWADAPGAVAYNLEAGAFEIRYDRELSKKEVEKVLEAFGIINDAYCVCIDG